VVDILQLVLSRKIILFGAGVETIQDNLEMELLLTEHSLI